MYCLDCGEVAGCPDCSISLTFHKKRERLVCHYCGQSLPFPLICAGCGGSRWLPVGEGTEKLEESLAEALPEGAAVLRLDRDATRRPGRMEAILEDFAAGRAQVLVGTQMLSKGHHFPAVTQVIVADGDMGLNMPDFRATERTFQLLVQVSGRAGRGERPGRVSIQTRSPGHYCWEHIRSCDYAGFYARELELRRKRGYPPFVKLALVRMDFPHEREELVQVVMDLGQAARSLARDAGLVFLGPAPAPIRLLKGRRRFHSLIKGQDWRAMRDLFGRVAELLGPRSPVRLTLDLDPVDMM